MTTTTTKAVPLTRSAKLVREFLRGRSGWPCAKYATLTVENMKDFLFGEYSRAINDSCENLFNNCFPNWNEYRRYESDFLALVGKK